MRVGPCVMGFGYWVRPSDNGAEACMVVGTYLDRDSLGLVRELRDRPDLRARLVEPRAVAVDESEIGRLGLDPSRTEQTAEVNGQHLRVVGRVRGLKALGGPYVFCSVETAREPQLAAARARAEADAAEARLKQAQEVLDGCTLRAP